MRGDEPKVTPLITRSVTHLPHMRGDEPEDVLSLPGQIYICPTCVGMNRYSMQHHNAQ